MNSPEATSAYWSAEALNEAIKAGDDFASSVVLASEQIARTRDPSGQVTEHMVREASVLLGNLRARRDHQLSTLGGTLLGVGASGVIGMIATPDPPLFGLAFWA